MVRLCSRQRRRPPRFERQVFSRPEERVDDSATPTPRALLPRVNETAAALWPQLTRLAQDIRSGRITCEDQ